MIGRIKRVISGKIDGAVSRWLDRIEKNLIPASPPNPRVNTDKIRGYLEKKGLDYTAILGDRPNFELLRKLTEDQRDCNYNIRLLAKACLARAGHTETSETEEILTYIGRAGMSQALARHRAELVLFKDITDASIETGRNSWQFKSFPFLWIIKREAVPRVCLAACEKILTVSEHYTATHIQEMTYDTDSAYFGLPETLNAVRHDPELEVVAKEGTPNSDDMLMEFIHALQIRKERTIRRLAEPLAVRYPLSKPMGHTTAPFGTYYCNFIHGGLSQSAYVSLGAARKGKLLREAGMVFRELFEARIVFVDCHRWGNFIVNDQGIFLVDAERLCPVDYDLSLEMRVEMLFRFLSGEAKDAGFIYQNDIPVFAREALDKQYNERIERLLRAAFSEPVKMPSSSSLLDEFYKQYKKDHRIEPKG